MDSAIDETKGNKAPHDQLARVLLVDNYRPRILIFQSLFDCLHCTLDVASSASDAVEKVALQCYNLVLVNLHHTDNADITHAIRAFERTTLKNPLEIVGIMVDGALEDRGLNDHSDLNECMPSLSPHYIESRLHLSVIHRREPANDRKSRIAPA